MRQLLEFSWSPWKSTLDSGKVQNIQMGHMTSYIIMRPCQYTLFCVNTLWKINCYLQPRNNSNILDLSSPLLIDSFILSSLLKECRLEKAGSSEHQLPPLQAACDVTWAVWSPWEKTLMHTGNNQGNTGRVQRNANIFRVLKKQYHTHAHRKILTLPTLTHTQTHTTSYTHLTTIRTHTYITQQRNKKTTTTPLTKLSPSAFA